MTLHCSTGNTDIASDYIDMHVYTYIEIIACTCIIIGYLSDYVHVYTCVWVRMYIRTCECVWEYSWLCMCIHVYVCEYMWMCMREMYERKKEREKERECVCVRVSWIYHYHVTNRESLPPPLLTHSHSLTPTLPHISLQAAIIIQSWKLRIIQDKTPKFRALPYTLTRAIFRGARGGLVNLPCDI